MRLIAARLERVRQHRLLELRLTPGFNLIGGANESGKSTVVEALHKALFLKATASGRGVEELRSLTHGGLPEVELQFEAAGSQWLLRKRFAGSGGTCQLSRSAGATLLGQEAETQLAALLQVSGPVEGRRIAQLPLRWAHLWVRQGEAGSDPLAGGGEAYDLPRLVQQLQSSDGSALEAAANALESPLDRQVQQHLRQELELQLTATGKVRAGSPLAVAQHLENEARTALSLGEQRLAELEASMAELAQINARLEAIEQQERPALQQQQQLRNQVQQLQAAHQQMQVLQQQLQADQQLRQSLQQQLNHGQEQQQQLQQGIAQLQRQHSQHKELQQRLVQQQELLGLQRDLAALQREETQLRSHKNQFVALQQQAAAIKQQLQQLPPITPEQVRQLRQAEQQLAQAQARAQGMASRLSLICSDQDVRLDGLPLAAGESQLLEQAAVLEVGTGTRLAISPGGGTAIDAAREQRQQASATLRTLQDQLGLGTSDAADGLAQQRQALESELNNLRKTAQTIPWAQLDAQLAELEPRRQRLHSALAVLESSADSNADLSALEAAQDSLKQQSQQLSQGISQLEQQLRQRQQELEQLIGQQGQHQRELARLSGGLAATTRQLETLQQDHGSSQQLEAEREQLAAALQSCDQSLAALRQQRGSATDSASQLAQLEAEKDTLLTRRGQQEQLCRSLGAQDPAAAVEQLRAAWEQAAAEHERISQRTAALQLLLEAFASAQQASASHYCLPLQAALQGYLEALELPHAAAAQMDYTPQQGFAALQLQQGSQSFDFGQLSGGMREQLAAALRLALAEVLQGAYDGCLPLVFDDAFSNCDPQRRSGVLQMLQRGVERGLQIVMFSCTPDDFAPLARRPEQRIDLGA